MKNLFSILCLVFFVVSCSEVRTVSSLDYRNGLEYEPNQNTPFTGKYVSYWDEGQGKRKDEWNYKNGKRDGVSVTWFSNGRKRGQVRYKDGKKDGFLTYWHKKGDVTKTEKYKDGKLVERKSFDNEYVQFWDNGNKKREVENFTKRTLYGRMDGLVTTWYENGQKEGETNYRYGRPHGLNTTWYKTGEKGIERHYKNGELDGLWTQWYKNGQKERQGNFKDGKQDGHWVSWYGNGRKKQERNYKEGNPDGPLTIWEENGKKKFEGSFNKNVDKLRIGPLMKGYILKSGKIVHRSLEE